MTKDITEKFNELREKNQYWSSWTCFTVAIKNKNISRAQLHKLFNKLVDKNDYDEKDTKRLIDWLEKTLKQTRTQ